MEKNKKVILIPVICLVGLLLISGIFIGIRNISFSDNNQENNGINEDINQEETDNNDEESKEEIDYDYQLVKVLDYEIDENDKGGNNPSVLETKNHYVVDMMNAYNSRVIVYDKEGNDVTKKLFGVDNISYIDGFFNSEDTFIVQTTDDKYGLYDSDFKELVKIGNYLIERTDNDNYFIIGEQIDLDNVVMGQIIGVKKNVGVYNKNGKLIIPREYEFVSLVFGGNNKEEQGLFYAYKNGHFGVIDENNKVVIPFEYDRKESKLLLGLGEIFTGNKKNYFIMYKNGKYGMIDENNNVIIDFDKKNLFYNEYANVVVEEFRNKEYEITKLNIYNLDGKLKKEIKLDDSFKVIKNAYHYSVGEINFLLYDKEYVYILNKNLEYDKYKGSAYTGYGMDSSIFLSGKGFYLKETNEKYQIYKTSDDSLMMNDEFYFDEIYNNFGIVLCKEKNNSKCGIIGFDGEVKLDFKYNDSDVGLKNGNEIVVYDENTNKLKKNTYKVNKQCLNGNGEYYFDNKIIKLDGEIYDYNCNKLIGNVANIYSVGDDLMIAEVFQDGDYNVYSIYDLNTFKLAKIENNDNVTIINEIENKMLVATDKGIYRIVKKQEN